MGCVWHTAGSSLSGQQKADIVNSGGLDLGPYGMCLAHSRKQPERSAEYVPIAADEEEGRKEEEGGRRHSALFKTSTQPLEGWELPAPSTPLQNKTNGNIFESI